MTFKSFLKFPLIIVFIFTRFLLADTDNSMNLNSTRSTNFTMPSPQSNPNQFGVTKHYTVFKDLYEITAAKPVKLEALFNKTTNAGSLLLNNSNKTVEEFDIEFIRSLLQRIDINAGLIKKCIESNCDDINQFNSLLQYEQEHFTENNLNEANQLISLITQSMYVLLRFDSFIVEKIAKGFFAFGFIWQLGQATIDIVRHEPNSKILNSLLLSSLLFGLYIIFNDIIRTSPLTINHWFEHQFSFWNMLSKFYSVIKNVLMTAPFVWISYKLLNNIIIQRQYIVGLQKITAKAPQRSLFEAALYAFLERMYDSGHMTDLGQLPEIAHQLGVPGI